MTFSPAPAAAGAPPAAAFPRSARSAHMGRRVGVVLTDSRRRVGILRGWSAYELTIETDHERALRIPVGCVAYVVNLHTFTR